MTIFLPSVEVGWVQPKVQNVVDGPPVPNTFPGDPDGLGFKRPRDTRLPTTSNLTQVCKVLREVGVGDISQVLLQLSPDLPARRRIEGVIEFPKRLRRSYQNQSIELVPGVCLIQCAGNLVDEVLFLGPVQILPGLDSVASRICALMGSAWPLHPELVSMTVDIR